MLGEVVTQETVEVVKESGGTSRVSEYRVGWSEVWFWRRWAVCALAQLGENGKATCSGLCLE